MELTESRGSARSQRSEDGRGGTGHAARPEEHMRED